jgi:hypothetical protein
MTHDRASETEARIRSAMGQLLTGPIPDGLKCDVKSLCVLSGVPRATLYRTYPHLKAEFEQERGEAQASGRQPDHRVAQIERLKTETTKLRERLSNKDTEINTLQQFRNEALSRLAAQHEEITALRHQLHAIRSAKVRTLPSATPKLSSATPGAPAELPRPVRARITEPATAPLEQQREPQTRLAHPHRRNGQTISSLACPTCGHEPLTRPEALKQREDLTVVWLHQHTPHGPITQHQHCSSCQPHDGAALLECVRCGDGPILTGTLAKHLNQHGPHQLPAELHTWLTSSGWQLEPEPLCPHKPRQ